MLECVAKFCYLGNLGLNSERETALKPKVHLIMLWEVEYIQTESIFSFTRNVGYASVLVEQIEDGHVASLPDNT